MTEQDETSLIRPSWQSFWNISTVIPRFKHRYPVCGHLRIFWVLHLRAPIIYSQYFHLISRKCRYTFRYIILGFLCASSSPTYDTVIVKRWINCCSLKHIIYILNPTPTGWTNILLYERVMLNKMNNII